ncbi:hypothetical protein Ddye_013500 [Dipteronia dyeriana]|uniref:RNase H type-1 domain-containing protein n=1 Tax=Dipteronia dyeriana TaxID=168575 RepID=A0AAD9X6E8_9ROSI|nr:hypothetical protein Ddye_013500 [Dipteronia dyeriana]
MLSPYLFLICTESPSVLLHEAVQKDERSDLKRGRTEPEDVEMSLSIPVSSSRVDVSRTWHYTSNGEYTVKSSYNLASSDQRIEACYSLQITKTVAILRGIELVRDLGMVPTVVESDALGVVKLINVMASVISDVGLVLNDISNIIRGADIVSVLFAFKKSNMVAYSFLRMALNVVNDCFWVKDHPLFVGNLIRQDLLV